MLYCYCVRAEFAIKKHGENAVAQSVETSDDKVEDQLSDSRTSSIAQASLTGKKSTTNSKRRRPSKCKNSETKMLDCRKRMLFARAKRAAFLKYSSLKYRAKGKIPCMLCPKDGILKTLLSVTAKNWFRHCCRMHTDFIAYRSQMVGYILNV